MGRKSFAYVSWELGGGIYRTEITDKEKLFKQFDFRDVLLKLNCAVYDNRYDELYLDLELKGEPYFFRFHDKKLLINF